MDTIQMAGATMGAILVLIGGIISIYRIARRIDNSIGLDQEGRTVSDRMGRVEHQLWPNGGSSLADKVNELDRQSRETSGEVKVILNLLQIMVAKD
jgi:hypothetical protein